MSVGLNGMRQYGMRQEPRQMPLGPTQTISNNQQYGQCWGTVPNALPISVGIQYV